jgi:Asp-tRNA(Asn)/Glu-tRNA(Gln) amidotransferase B subunit
LVSRRIKFQFFAKLFEADNLNKTVWEVAEENNLFVISDRGVIEKALVEELFAANEKALEQYKSKPKKREKLVEYFVRILHLRFEDRADPDLVNSVVVESLEKLVKA